jgi:hypothetical protein
MGAFKRLALYEVYILRSMSSALKPELAVYRHLNLYRFNSIARILKAWPDYPEAKNG